MSLHKKNDLGRKALDVIDPSGDVPKYRIPRAERLPREGRKIRAVVIIVAGSADEVGAGFESRDAENAAIVAPRAGHKMWGFRGAVGCDILIGSRV